MDTELTLPLPVSATELGFVIPVFEKPDLPTVIKEEALASVHIISRELALKATDPTTSVPHRISINEQLIKLAGLDKKASEMAASSGVSISINIPAIDTSPAKTITIDTPALDVSDAEYTIPISDFNPDE